MRVVGVTEFGGPEMLTVHEMADPVPGPGEVLVNVRAATVNPTDTYTRNGARAEMLAKLSPPPYVPGMDAAGVLAAIGPDTDTDLEVGDSVMAMVIPRGDYGAYSDQLVVPAASTVRTPSGVDYAHAATLPMNGLTAQLTLDLLGLQSGQMLAVTGAAGCYGGYVVQLAKEAGLRVIADASEADDALVTGLGADVVVRRGPDVADRIRKVAPDGVDGVADGSVQNEALFPALRDGGGFATVRGFKAEAPRGITVHPVWVRDYDQRHDKLDRLRDLAEAGKLTLRVAKVFPAAEAAEAHRLLEAGGTRGRFVLRFPFGS
jgi:NADPH:quinone reductase